MLKDITPKRNETILWVIASILLLILLGYTIQSVRTLMRETSDALSGKTPKTQIGETLDVSALKQAVDHVTPQ